MLTASSARRTALKESDFPGTMAATARPNRIGWEQRGRFLDQRICDRWYRRCLAVVIPQPIYGAKREDRGGNRPSPVQPAACNRTSVLSREYG